VQALFRIRSARQRLTMGLPPSADFDADPLRINGHSVTLERGEREGEFSVPLPSASADEPFLLELRYTVPGGGPLELPVFVEGPKDEPAVQKVYLCVFVARDAGPPGHQRPVDRGVRLGATAVGLGFFALNRQGDPQRVGWSAKARRKTPAPAPTPSTPTAHCTFSRPCGRRPTPGWWSHGRSRGLSGLVFAVIVLGGLALLPARCSRRVLAIGGADHSRGAGRRLPADFVATGLQRRFLGRATDRAGRLGDCLSLSLGSDHDGMPNKLPGSGENCPASQPEREPVRRGHAERRRPQPCVSRCSHFWPFSLCSAFPR